MSEPNQRPGVLPNLLFNIVIPTLVLTKLSADDRLGPALAIVVALAFPIAFGLREYRRSHRPSFFSLLGIGSVLLTGGMSLLELDPAWIAVKEAAVPGLLGLATLASTRTQKPLVRLFLYNEDVMQVDKVAKALIRSGTGAEFERTLLVASWLIAGSFFLSSTLNYLLAKWILVSPAGTTAYAEELGRMTALSYPVIALPSTLVMMATLFYLLRRIQALTGLELEDIFRQP